MIFTDARVANFCTLHLAGYAAHSVNYDSTAKKSWDFAKNLLYTCFEGLKVHISWIECVFGILGCGTVP